MICEHCNAKLLTRSSLGRHQRKNQVCLVAQGKQLKLDERTKPEPCVACGKEFVRKAWHDEHLRTCPAVGKQKRLQRTHEEALEKVRRDLLEEKERAIVNLSREHEMVLEEKEREMADLKREHRIVLEDAQDELETLEREILDVKDLLQREHLAHAVSEGKLEVQTENVHLSLAAAKTTNNYYLANMTEDLGPLLADRLTRKEFWDGQRGIARSLRHLKNEAGKPFYRVRDENRAKLDILLDDRPVRDDGAEMLIKTVERPVKDKIKDIRDDLIEEEMDVDGEIRVQIQAAECLRFSEPGRNSLFIKGLTKKSGAK